MSPARFIMIVLALGLVNAGASLIVAAFVSSNTELLVWNGTWLGAAGIAILVRLSIAKNGDKV